MSHKVDDETMRREVRQLLIFIPLAIAFSIAVLAVIHYGGLGPFYYRGADIKQIGNSNCYEITFPENAGLESIDDVDGVEDFDLMMNGSFEVCVHREYSHRTVVRRFIDKSYK